METQSVTETTFAPRDPVLATLVAQLPVGVVVAARDGSLELVNDVARKLFAEHRPASRVTPAWRASNAPADVLDPIQWVIARVFLTGEIIRDEEIEFVDRRDEWRTLSVSGTPLEDADGEITNALVSFVDVTATKRAREWEPLIRAISRL